MLISGRQKLLTKPGKGAIDSETPYRDEMIVTLSRYMLRKGISASKQKSGPTSAKLLGRSPAKPLACPCSQHANERSFVWITV